MVDLAALFALACVFGGMLFFAAVMAPLVFTRLPGDQAGPFIRAVFPVYYLYVLIGSASAALTLLPSNRQAAATMAVVAVATVWLRQWLMRRINLWSDAWRAGDIAAKRRFDLGHRLSVAVNLAQMAAIGWVLSGFAG